MIEATTRMMASQEQKRHLPSALAVLLLGINAFAIPLTAAEPSSSQLEQWWSLRPLREPAVPKPPAGKFANWPRNELDRFILAKLLEKGLSPSPQADKPTLLRRVCFDLSGLPPTAEEMRDFLRDRSPRAFARVVERLLASPRYGERWARHWLDVVHYADTHGHDQDRPRPNAWPYRDYVVRAFNEDKPYARFVQEQLAGDVLFLEDPQAVVATGFIAAGPWDESSQKAIVDDTVDKKIGRNLDRDDMVMTAFSTFASTTVHCARCHNHKFDPILQSEYYSLQAVFAGVDRADRPYDSDPEIFARRRALLKQKRALEAAPKAEKPDPLQLAAAQKELQQAREKQAAIWTVLDPATFKSAGGATLTKQPDFSLLAGGAKPDKDTYSVVSYTPLKGITAVRLELLTDPSLPHLGPGRQDNGNLHLSEFQITAAPGTNVTAATTVSLQNPTADFNQQDWAIEKAIDGNPSTAWGIFPEIGHPHQAVFEIKTSIANDQGTTLTFTLEQAHGRNHLIGRFRLAVTTAPLAVRADRVPYSIVQILDKPERERSEQAKSDLLTLYRKYQIDEQLAALPPPQMVYAAANDFPVQGNFAPAKVPRPIFLLKRGDVTRPGEPAAPGALSCLNELSPAFELKDPDDEGSRRAALAKWLTDPRNVLAWRSIVNRIWHYHFGHGLVETPNDFGRMGARPSHPELLDWLALWFLDHGGSIKQLHRLMLESATYQQSSEDNPQFAKIDSGNSLLWRMNRSRLDAESIRDAVLQVTGKLNTTMGGPAVMQFSFEDPNPGVTPKVDYSQFDVDSPQSYRRSIYRYLFRTLPDPFMDCLDCADGAQLTAVRNVSFTALQAMTMMNDRFIVRQSEHLAERLAKASRNPGKQIQLAYDLALGRPATSTEIKLLKAYASKHGLANACRIIFNSNEFMFVN